MSLAISRENFFLHKLHSLTGVVPVGFYMVQHLTLNSFSLAGPEKFNSIGAWFGAIPFHLFIILEAVAIWIPLLFHSIYGMFITNRSQPNFLTTKYKWSQNRQYTIQRWSGVLIFFFLIYHVSSTTIYKYVVGDHRVVEFAAWNAKLTSLYGFIALVYMVGIAASSYHLAYGLWNFAIRWGIAISEKAQHRIQRFSVAAFIGLTVLGWTALAGFVIPREGAKLERLQGQSVSREMVPTAAPAAQR